MIPVLYQTITEGQVPANFGIGPLTDTLACSVHEVRNAEDELVLEYAASGIHAAEIAPLAIIKAKPNYTDDPQLFEIYKVGKVLNGRFTVNARHISYRLSNRLITTGTANTCVAACNLLNAQAGAFTISTDKTSVGAFRISEPASVRSYFGGKAGSLLDIYGGEWKYDNFTCQLLNARGMDRGVTIRYGKNLTQLSQEISIENLATAILPFYKDPDGNVTTGAKVQTGLTLSPARELAVDFSQDVDPDSGTAITTQLANLAARYIANNNFTVAFNSITLDFQQLEGLTERVDLCDTVKIYFDALGITATAKCVATTWDVLAERYTACTFGNTRANIADTIATQTKELSQTASRSFLAESVNRATALISGNLGGYVVLHDSDGDGEPDEILIMNTPDISTATKVWRWNKAGLGYSSTGYAGPFGTAITADGEIVANYVNTGVLNADLIKAGTIEDAGHNSNINMTTGEAKLKNLTAREKLVLVNSSNQERGNWQFTGTECHFAIRDTNLHNVGEIWSNTYGGHIRLSNTSQKYSVSLITNNDGSGAFGLHYANGNYKTFISDYLQINNTDGTTKVYLGNTITLNHTNGSQLAQIFRNGYGRGQLDLFNEYGTKCVSLFGDGGLGLSSSGSYTITGIGSTGVLTCIQLVQTSSRKVKENIRPIEDAARILELNAVNFDFKNKDLGVNKCGFIAEDVAEVLPGLVTPETEDRPAALDYIGMIPYLQQIIKEHEARIKALENEIDQLKKARAL